jgi:chaperonin cofactor prefoldin
MKKKTVMITAIAATIATIGAAIFVAKKGPELKEDLLKRVDTLKERIKDLEVSEVKEAIHSKLVEIKNEIKDFDWEKPKEEVEKKFYELRKQLKSVKKHIPLTEEVKES